MERKVYHHEDIIRDYFIPASAILAVEERLEMISCLKRVISFLGSKKGAMKINRSARATWPI